MTVLSAMRRAAPDLSVPSFLALHPAETASTSSLCPAAIRGGITVLPAGCRRVWQIPALRLPLALGRRRMLSPRSPVTEVR